MNKHLSRIISGLAALALALTCCIGTAACTPEKSPEEVIRETLSTELERFKELDDDTMAELMEGMGTTTDALEQFGITGEEMLTATLDGFDYEVGTIDVDDDGETATAEVSITFKDVAALPGELETAMGELIEDPEIISLATDQDALYARLGEEVMDVMTNLGTKTSTVDLDLTKTDDSWDVAESGEKAIEEALTGGLS